jgi:phosphate transport system permease protein
MKRTRPETLLDALRRPRSRLIQGDQSWVRYFLGGSASLSVIILVLITLFLFREAVGFFPQHVESLRLYRQSGMEFAHRADGAVEAVSKRLRLLHAHLAEGIRGDDWSESEQAAWWQRGRALEAVLDDFTDLSVDLAGSAIEARELIIMGSLEEASQLRVQLQTRGLARWAELVDDFELVAAEQLKAFPTLAGRSGDLKNLTREWHQMIGDINEATGQLQGWNPSRSFTWVYSFRSFAFGQRWLTNSFKQDLFGILPLLIGSFVVALGAVFIAVPIGVGAAAYVAQYASRAERNFLKPAIEFVAVIPSVLLGFFGITVLGELFRELSRIEWLAALPGFPIVERLNIFTAAFLLAIMAVPTIFTLSEDAIRSVPKSLVEGSFALGANRLQTILNVIFPSAASGISSAVLLGFGRVVGETMIVLLCAGNRIAIPDFTAGLGVFFEPTHTMTGIIAQEMGEVSAGSLHYRALFVVGATLFLITLSLNYAAQRLMRRYRVVI